MIPLALYAIAGLALAGALVADELPVTGRTRALRLLRLGQWVAGSLIIAVAWPLAAVLLALKKAEDWTSH